MSLLKSQTVFQYIPLIAIRCVRGEDRLILSQSVRWRRRRWSPQSYTKMYYVRDPTPKDPEEIKELQIRVNQYRTTMRALRNFLHEQRFEKENASKTQEIFKKSAEAIESVLIANEQWNLETAKLREARVAEEERSQEQIQLERLIRLEQRESDRLQRADAIIQKQQDLASSFITLDTLDAEIDRVLDTEKSHNFVLDKTGSKYTEERDGSLSQESIEKQIEQLTLVERKEVLQP